jgi:PucR C-terminal helix-turn-helix domain/GGDEF-like domain
LGWIGVHSDTPAAYSRYSDTDVDAAPLPLMAGRELTDPAGRRLVADVARGLLSDAALDGMAAESAAQIIASEAAYAQAGVVIADIRRATRSTLSLALARIGGADSSNLDGVIYGIGRLRAEQGVPLVAVLHAFRLDFRVLWSALVEAGRASAVTARPEFIEGCIDVWNTVEAITEEVLVAYRSRERELDDRRVEELERAFAELVAEGASSPPVLERCASVLGLPDEGAFAVIVGSISPDHSECIGRLLSACTRLGLAAHFSGGADDVRGVIERSQMGDEQFHSLLMVLSPGRFGVAPLVGSLGGLARSLRFAAAALNTLPRGRLGVVRLEDAWTLAVMHRDDELADAFARHVLAGVLAAPAGERDRLLHTLRAYITSAGSVSGVAEAEFLHRNTVRKRLARIEVLTGRALSDPQDITDLTLATTWLRIDGNRRTGRPQAERTCGR